MSNVRRRNVLFGDQSVFAIEAMSEPTLVSPSAVWGRMRVWCQGRFIGDYEEEHCALYHSYIALRLLATSLPSLWSNTFNGLSDVELFDRLDDLLYGYRGAVETAETRPLEQCKEDVDVYGKHNFLVNWGEQFDQAGKSFIFSCGTSIVKILTRPSIQMPVRTLQAPTSAVRESIHQFCDWFEREQERLQRGSDS